MRLPIRARLTLIFASTTLVVLAVAASILLVRFRAEIGRAVDDGLRSRAATILAAEGTPLETFPQLIEGDEAFAQLLAPDGRVLRSSPGVEGPLLPQGSVSSLRAGAFFEAAVAMTDETVQARLLAVPAGDGSILVVGVDVEDQRQAAARLTTLVAVGGPVLLVAITLLGWALAGAALRPVERLRSEAAAISATEPSRRLHVPNTGDEVQRLASTLNGMLDRLHEALDRERRFVDEASHELRTPLGVLRAEVELALKEPRSPDELRAALRSVREEAERLRRLTQDLLVLARSDRGRLPVHRADEDVARILARVVAEFRDRAHDRGVDLRVSGRDVRARVDGERIRQAVENLVDNALRHTGRGGVVEVDALANGERLEVSVVDSGTGFPNELLLRAFEPFARADAERDGDGAGLGLAIVYAVAQAHGGTARVENRAGGGAAVTISLPR